MSRNSRILRGNRLHAVAIATLLAIGAPMAGAAIQVTGGYGTNPGGLLIDDANNNLGTAQAYFQGSLLVDNGSLLTLGTMTFDFSSGPFTESFIGGVGTRVNLIGAGNRLEVGNSGRGFLTVSGGAVVDARALTSPAVDCGACFSFISNGAGSTGELTITGAGSFVNLWALTVGQAAVFTQAANGFDFGLPGGLSRGVVNVRDGGSLQSVASVISSGAFNNGPERTHGFVTVEGAGSTWRITSNLVNGIDASVLMATQANATAELEILDGGSLLIDAVPGRFSLLHIGQRGKADAWVSGADANITFASGASGLVQIGRNAGAIGTLSVLNGGRVSGVYYTSIGRDGGVGTLTVDGAGSLYRLNGSTDGVAGAGGTGPSAALLDVARGGGTGTLNVRNGGKVEIAATTSRPNSPGFNVGRDATSVGIVNVTGAGSTIEITAASTVAGGGPTEARNPFVNVGRLGTGVLNVTAGGKVLMQGNAVSTVADPRSTSMNIGGTGDSNSGGVGNVLVSGAGSEIALTGSDPFIGIGMGAGATGNLTIANQGLVRSTNINVGRSGGVGVVQMDNGRIELRGQQTGNTLAGAFMSIGLGGGSGVMTMSNGSVVSVENVAGTAATGFQLGGSQARPGGSGVLQMSGGSRIEIAGPANLGLLQVGRDGVGVVQMSDSDVDVGSTGLVHIGRAAGGSGVIRMSDNSTLTAGFVGVGRHQLADLTNADGGVGVLNVSSGSVVTAANLVIGTKGVLSGDGTINANVTNYGVISPGNSPGTLVINGNFSDAGGKLVLEIESDGLGGFNKDKIIFGPTSVVDFGGLNIEFQFLGATDPAAFLATGDFDVDAFIVRDDGAGNLAALPDSIYTGASFSAATEAGPLAGIVITPGGTVTAVPEPQTYALFGFGLAVLAWARRRARS